MNKTYIIKEIRNSLIWAFLYSIFVLLVSPHQGYAFYVPIFICAFLGWLVGSFGWGYFNGKFKKD